MVSIRNSICVILVLFFQINTFTAQQFFSCGGTGGIYSLLLVNPNAMDSDDGNIDGNCEYIFRTSIFSSLNAAVYNYVGTGTANPTSVTHTRVPLAPGVITVLSPCGNLDIAFDITETNNTPLCMIRNSIMPVELTNFQAQSIKGGVLLNWTTASEIDNKGFDIERSINSKIWKKLDFIEGNLTTLEAQNYEFVDQKPHEGASYYRLKQLDIDGQYEYSEIISVDYKYDKSKFGIFPNPAEEVITLSLSEKLEYESMEVRVFDHLGRLVKQEKKSNNNLIVNDLSSGVYLLTINVNKTVYFARFVKK